jgi:hypothetical protein
VESYEVEVLTSALSLLKDFSSPSSYINLLTAKETTEEKDDLAAEVRGQSEEKHRKGARRTMKLRR